MTDVVFRLAVPLVAVGSSRDEAIEKSGPNTEGADAWSTTASCRSPGEMPLATRVIASAAPFGSWSGVACAPPAPVPRWASRRWFAPMTISPARSPSRTGFTAVIEVPPALMPLK